VQCNAVRNVGCFFEFDSKSLPNRKGYCCHVKFRISELMQNGRRSFPSRESVHCHQSLSLRSRSTVSASKDKDKARRPGRLSCSLSGLRLPGLRPIGCEAARGIGTSAVGAPFCLRNRIK
jgi:hypothetical protein